MKVMAQFLAEVNSDDCSSASKPLVLDGARREKGREGDTEPEHMIPLKKRLAAELVGTFALVFAAAGSDAANVASGHEIGLFAVAAAPGFVLVAMIYAMDKMSGAYFNPAVTIGFAISGHLRNRETLPYILVQMAGAAGASIIVSLIIFPIGESDTGLTLPHTGWAQSFVLEVVLTFFLMLIGITMKEKIGYKPFGGIAIGGYIIAAGIVGIPISGASMNPARSFGPALVSLDFSYLWIYWLAPIIGAVLAIIVFKAMKDTRAKVLDPS